MAFCAVVPSRQVWRLTGRDVWTVLNNLATNDKAGFCHWLNPQGRVLFDAFVVPAGDDFLVEVDASVEQLFRRHLGMYSLRKDVKATAEPRFKHVLHVTGFQTAAPGIWQRDTRLWDAWRLYSETGQGLEGLPRRDVRYETARLLRGCAEGAAELGIAKAISLEWNLDRQGGVSFEKGCYLGQELVSRSHFSGVVRKRLTPVVVAESSPPESLLFGGEGKSKEELHSEAIAFLSSVGNVAANVGAVKAGDAAAVETIVDAKGKECGSVIRRSGEFGQLALAMLRVQYVGSREEQLSLKDGGARVWPLNIN